jgi:hypothetical protein
VGSRCSRTSRSGTPSSTTAAGRSRARRSTSRSARRDDRSERSSTGNRNRSPSSPRGGLGDPPTTDRLRGFLSLYPGLRFKLDARPDWTDAIFAELQSLGCVDSVDLKGQYSGTVVDNPPDPGLYRRVIEVFPDAWLEDPALTDATVPLLEPHADRVTWDAPIHSVADIEALRWPPRTVNVKPSRFGTIERLFAAYDYCEAKGIGAYGGGQWELSVGRGHIQLLAALFHPDTPNDVAPGGYNAGQPPTGLPASPLAVRPRETGFAAL